jgi:UDP-N-acetylmuramoylalanine--D-glutamate ligase
MKITENQNENDHFVYNYDDDRIRNSVKKIKAERSAFSLNGKVTKEVSSGAYLDKNDLVYFYDRGEEKIIDTRKFIMKGQHNIYNAMASVIPAKILSIKNEQIAGTIENFKGVEHRLEFVRDINGIKFYNDSKATNVNSVWYALQGFNEPIVLILGGKDKGNDYSLIKEEVKQYVMHIVAMGESKQKVYNFFKEIVPVTLADDMEDAVYKAAANASRNGVVLLSPACASFDMFENYEHRGREFKKIVNKM